MSILSTMTIPSYSRNETTGRAYAIFGDRGVEFGPYDDPQSIQAFDRTLAAWLQHGRRLPDPDELAATKTAGPISFDRFCAELLELYGPQLRSVATRRGMRHALDVLRGLGVTSTSDFSVSLIARLVTTRSPTLSANTVVGLLRYVQTAMNYAAKQGYVKVSPFEIRSLRTWVRRSAPKGAKTAYMTKAQIRAILDRAAADVAERQGFAQWRSRRLEFLVNLLAYTGVRKAEALWSKVEDFDFDLNVFFITPRVQHQLKTEKSAQPVAMVPPLREKALEWISHRLDAPPALLRPLNDWMFPNVMQPTPWFGGCQGNRPLDKFRELAVRAGVPPEIATLHALRRSLATHLESQGCGQAMITRILRHTMTATTTKFYQKADITGMHKALDGFTY